MYYLVYLNGFCNGNKGGHALDTSATPQQTQKYIKKARSISKLRYIYISLLLRPTIFHN